jgi:hypothetical protein
MVLAIFICVDQKFVTSISGEITPSFDAERLFSKIFNPTHAWKTGYNGYCYGIGG